MDRRATPCHRVTPTAMTRPTSHDAPVVGRARRELPVRAPAGTQPLRCAPSPGVGPSGLTMPSNTRPEEDPSWPCARPSRPDVDRLVADALREGELEGVGKRIGGRSAPADARALRDIPDDRWGAGGDPGDGASTASGASTTGGGGAAESKAPRLLRRYRPGGLPGRPALGTTTISRAGAPADPRPAARSGYLQPGSLTVRPGG